MKRITALLAGAALTLATCSGCSTQGLEAWDTATDDCFKVVCTFFPVYDWTRTVAGDVEDVSIKLLIENGVDLHSYQPTAQDLIAISDCDLLIFIGGESEEWIREVLERDENPERRVVCLMDVMESELKTEEIREGMQTKAHLVEEAEEEPEYDEHVWLSLKNTMLFCQEISDAFAGMDPSHASVYQTAADSYVQQLAALDQEFEQTVASAKRTELLFGDRFPFRYFVEDYGLTYYAAFPGCSSESTATFETITFLSHQVDADELPAVCVVDGSDTAIAKAIVSNTREKTQKILHFQSMQSIDSSDSVTYLSIMQENLNTLQEAIG